MDNYKFLQPIETMERIGRKDIGERLDEVLETIERDDVGFVISDEGKHDLVLCPASWFAITFDDDFGCIVGCAVRYALGRYTYMPSLVADFVKKNLPVLNTQTLMVMVRDISGALKNNNLPCRDTWVDLKNNAEARLEEVLNSTAKKKGEQ